MSFTIGMTGTATDIVKTENTAVVMKSGTLPVFATPSMCALMEEAACNAINAVLPLGQSTVGTALTIKHLRATPVARSVKAEAKLTAIEGRKLTFIVEARDENGVIGKGEHERFLVDNEKFLEKLNKLPQKTLECRC